MSLSFRFLQIFLIYTACLITLTTYYPLQRQDLVLLAHILDWGSAPRPALDPLHYSVTSFSHTLVSQQ